MHPGCVVVHFRKRLSAQQTAGVGVAAGTNRTRRGSAVGRRGGQVASMSVQPWLRPSGSHEGVLSLDRLSRHTSSVFLKCPDARCCEHVPNVLCSEGACACAVCVIALLRALARLRTCRAPKLYQASVLQPRSSKSKHQGYAKVPGPRGCWCEVKQGTMLPTRTMLRLGHPQACALEIASRPLSCTCVHTLDVHIPQVCSAPPVPSHQLGFLQKRALL